MKAPQLYLKRWFLQGIVVIMPLILTCILFSVVVTKTDEAISYVRSFLSQVNSSIETPNFTGAGLLISTSIIILVGMTTESVIIKRIIAAFNNLIKKLPFIRSIYSTIHKLLESILNQQSFSRVVLVEFPQPGTFSIGFVTGSSPIVIGNNKNDMMNVFIPTAPIPTNGFYLIIPKNKLIETNLTPEQALRLVVSIGIDT